MSIVMANWFAPPSAGLSLGTYLPSVMPIECGGSRKVAERVMTKLQRTREDPRAVGGALRRLNNHSKMMQIQILEHLVDEQDWQLALPMYKSLREKEWFQWNPSLHAKMVALLATAQQSQEMESLILETPENLTVRDRLNLQVSLIENFGKRGLLDHALVIFQELQFLPFPSAGHSSYRALVRAYVHAGLPHEAHVFLSEMKREGFKASLDDYKTLLYAYGRDGYLAEMEKIVEEISTSGLKMDKTGYNMMLSAYGQARKFDLVLETLEKMRRMNISCSVNSRNAISKSCPSISSLFAELEAMPANSASLCSELELREVSGGELAVIKELLILGVPADCVKYSEDAWELDLHHMFMGTANIALFLWLQQLKARCMGGVKFPVEVRVVTGWGKHSDVEGKSVVKQNVAEFLERLKSPFRVDSQNRGVMTARGSSLQAWLNALFQS
ncbi:protein MpPPR_66 [Marchantia polymorpha subsp. ruderalis]|uniref:Smr domain-containing protein n=2 Tax=Marchantia polymorpha TaxID=3197 RepID=A0A176WD25_MARPO|nr:hypothetical protein AXG93_4031s1430 [Marchantia polymorpha subsp. ruderalis]PTQ41332.1 hypothetical protein MARPO_0035s0104 [Marchantia polymorpha]BBN13411.1 hypothetical protein Mp_6g03240 [Marchantia polymorpha subsp. ruderalis]|eukprot:PTQ41332.1 hypothetical protein MARPO_0035s0104 [Marchantia polymorpha]